MTNNIMVDIETLGTRPNSAILSIGAVKFGQDGIDEDMFYWTIDIQSCVDAGLIIDPDTVAWWRKQSDEARAEFRGENAPLEMVLGAFSAWIPKGAKFWGNGAAFDNVIVANAYHAIGQKVPWEFWNDRCYRTVAAFSGVEREKLGTHHHALDDARSQAEHLLQIAPWAVQ